MYLYLQIVIEGIRGVGPQGDIAIDDIIVFRQGDASQPADLVPHGLPVTCKFGVCMCALNASLLLVIIHCGVQCMF